MPGDGATDLIVQSREFAPLYRAGSEDPGKLEPEERTQFNTFMVQVVSVYEALYFQFLNGAVDATYWNAKVPGLRSLMSHPGSRGWWARLGENGFDPRFHELVQRDVLKEPAV